MKKKREKEKKVEHTPNMPKEKKKKGENHEKDTMNAMNGLNGVKSALVFCLRTKKKRSSVPPLCSCIQLLYNNSKANEQRDGDNILSISLSHSIDQSKAVEYLLASQLFIDSVRGYSMNIQPHTFDIPRYFSLCVPQPIVNLSMSRQRHRYFLTNGHHPILHLLSPRKATMIPCRRMSVS